MKRNWTLGGVLGAPLYPPMSKKLDPGRGASLAPPLYPPMSLVTSDTFEYKSAEKMTPV